LSSLPSTPPVSTSKDNRQFDLTEIYAADDRILSTMLLRQAARFNDRTLFVCGETRWTYRQTAAVAMASARSLTEAGIKPGDRVAILCSNRSEFLQVYLGCGWLGAIAVPINVASRGRQLAHILSNSTPALIVVEDSLTAAFQTIEEPDILPRLIWTIDPNGLHDSGGTHIPAMLDAAVVHPPSTVKPSDTVAILYTSGTTGPAKGVCCPQAQLFWWGAYSSRALAIKEGEVLLTTLPLFHTNALNAFYQALLNGCTYVVEPKFSVSRFWTTVLKHDASVTYLLGAMAAMLLSQPASPSDRTHKLRVALGGGVPARFHGLFLERFGVPLLDGYASTETNFVFASPIPSDHPGTMGYLTDGAEAVIVDANDALLPDGEAGELLLRPTQPFAFATGYFAMPDRTVEAWRNLWFHTGDRVLREPDGHYRFIDRIKDAIRRRGENVSSWEVEEILTAHPKIAACAVYPLPSDLGEDEIAVAVMCEPACTIDPVEIVRFCEGKIAYFAVPRYVRFVSEMPLTGNGKIRKVALREEGMTADIWDREAAGYKLQR
jgi:crotonobetaine/carnitine-CoA ligase